jgi:pimeloyl-ACP methyl ester carboxylesterase
MAARPGPRAARPGAVAALRVPVLVVRGRDDALSTPGWASRLAGDYVEVPGPHTFCWRNPEAWVGAGPGVQRLSARSSCALVIVERPAMLRFFASL